MRVRPDAPTRATYVPTRLRLHTAARLQYGVRTHPFRTCVRTHLHTRGRPYVCIFALTYARARSTRAPLITAARAETDVNAGPELTSAGEDAIRRWK